MKTRNRRPNGKQKRRWSGAYDEGVAAFWAQTPRSVCPHGDGAADPLMIDIRISPRHSGWLTGWDMAWAFAEGMSSYINGTPCGFDNDVQRAEWAKGYKAASEAPFSLSTGALH